MTEFKSLANNDLPGDNRADKPKSSFKQELNRLKPESIKIVTQNIYIIAKAKL